MAARAIVFDVNETLLDLSALDPHFERSFSKPSVRQAWFNQLLQSALVATVTNAYADFGTLGAAALDMIAARHGVTLSQEERAKILEGVHNLPPYPEVAESLGRLKERGFCLAALTNSTAEVGKRQLKNAGLDGYFEQILSADTVQRLKPAPEPYRMAATSLNISVDGLRLVAAHAWDMAGALRAGCAAAFVARPVKVLNPLVEPPDIVGTDLREVTDWIIEVEQDNKYFQGILVLQH